MLKRISIAVAVAVALNAGAGEHSAAKTGAPAAHDYIVQAASINAACQDVASVGAGVRRELGIINAVSAILNERQVGELRKLP